MQVTERLKEADLLVNESIKMVEAEDFSLFKESHAQALVALKDNSLTDSYKNLVAQIIQELKNHHLKLVSISQSDNLEVFLNKNC